MNNSTLVTRWLFLHGGPGLSSEAERRLWGPECSARSVKVEFWDEPRQNSSAHAYSVSVESALNAFDRLASGEGERVGILAHSFGANLALSIAEKRPGKVAALGLIAPGTQTYTAFLRILRIGHEEAVKAGANEAAKIIENSLVATQVFADEPLLLGLAAALSVQGTVLRYWHDFGKMAQWAQVMQEPNWAVDATSQLGVMLAFKRELETRSTLRIDVPTWIAFGAEDEIISRADEVRYLSSRLKVVEQNTFENCGHFVQLEAPASLAEWVGRISGDPVIIGGGAQAIERTLTSAALGSALN